MPDRNTKAFAPGHITGFFYLPPELEEPLLSLQRRRVSGELNFKELLKMAAAVRGVGSVGAGLSLELGMTTDVELILGERKGVGKQQKAPAPECRYNGEKTALEELTITNFITKTLLKAYHEKEESMPRIAKLGFNIETPLPLAAGFGLSGAAALSTAFALEAALGLGLGRETLAGLAHLADCLFRGGLGDVAAQLVGGFEQRRRPGLPGVGELVNHPFNDEEAELVLLVSDRKLETASVLGSRERMSGIRKAGKDAAERFSTLPTLDNFFDQSYRFSQEAGLIPERFAELLHTINTKKGCRATPAQLGNTLVAWGDTETILELFQGQGRVIQARISGRKAGLI